MKILRRLCVTILLVAALAVPVFAGEIQTPPCANPGDTLTPPGETQGPPCSANRDADETAPTGITQTSDYIVSAEVDTAFDTIFHLLEVVF